jgi:hypothetical protein
MAGNSRIWRRTAAVSVAAAAVFVLAGCLDITFDIAIDSDGSGAIAVATVFSKEMSQAAESKNSGPSEIMLSRDNKNVRVKREMKDGRYSVTESLSFKQLSDVTLSESVLEVADLGRTFYGTDRTRVRWAGKQQPGKHSGEAKGDKEVSDLFKGYFYTVTMHVPCNVTYAGQPKIGGTVIKPDVQISLLHGSTVQWKVPMELIERDAGDGQPAFDLECWSWYGIKPGKTK